MVGAAVAVVSALAACTTARNSLGTTNSSCYEALPLAASAVHHRGILLGVRLADVSSLRTTRRVHLAAISEGTSVRRVCLVAYRGHFEGSAVVKPIGRPRRGPLAIVVLEFPHVKLLGTVVIRHVPVRFGHPRIG